MTKIFCILLFSFQYRPDLLGLDVVLPETRFFFFGFFFFKTILTQPNPLLLVFLVGFDRVFRVDPTHVHPYSPFLFKCLF